MTDAAKQEISTQAPTTSVILALYIGETYVEVGFFDQDSINQLRSEKLTGSEAVDTQVVAKTKTPLKTQPKKTSQNSAAALHSQLFYIPHQSLKSIFSQIKKIISEKNFSLKETFFVSRYLERLQNFRLGGSVAQLIPAGFENNIHFGNSLSLSLANPSLIISKSVQPMTPEELEQDIASIKKVNPDCDKIIVYDFTESFIDELLVKNGFQVFRSSLKQKSQVVRKTLFNAGISGTLKELFNELNELTQKTSTKIWVDGRWISFADAEAAQDSQSDFPLQLFMSGLNFLYHFNRSQKSDSPTQFHIDFDHWEKITAAPTSTWKSPWGEIECVAPFHRESLSIGPRQEILIDDTARLQISKNSSSIETGPFIAGRSVKSVVIDLFSDEILAQTGLYKMIGSPDLNVLNAKIKSQFKALDNGQKHEHQINCAELKNLIFDSIQTRIAFDSADFKGEALITGNLSFIFEQKNQKTDQSLFWTQAMMKTVIQGSHA